MYNSRMKKTDGRKLQHETLEEIRIRAVQQVEAGESPEVVIKALGFHRGQTIRGLRFIEKVVSTR